MKPCLLLLFVSIAACTTFTGQTSRSWRWSSPSNSVSSTRIDIVTDVTKDVFELRTGHKVPDSAFDKVDEIKFTYFETFCMPEEPGGSGKCKGQVDYKDREIWITLEGRCLASTSLSHELIHIFAKSVGMSDSDHDNPLLFEKAKGADEDSIEYQAEHESFKALGCTEIRLF